MSLKSIVDLVKSELDAFDLAIIEQLQAKQSFINELSHYIIKSGGKRLRPLLVLLGAKACHYEGNATIDLAVTMEYFHTATLLHDDVIDNSLLRRGKETANAVWGSKASVLVGDFLFTRAFQLLVCCKKIEIISVLADASNTITRGEVMQLLNAHNLTISQQQYMEVIHSKTATLFSAAAKMGAMLTDQPKNIIDAMGAYGLHLGNAFQLVDDALDYCGTSEQIGKNIGDDLAEGKCTLPLIYAYHHGNTEQQKIIQQAVKERKIDFLPHVQEIIESTKAIQYTYKIAAQEVDEALTALHILPETIYKEALIKLAHFSLKRDY